MPPKGPGKNLFPAFCVLENQIILYRPNPLYNPESFIKKKMEKKIVFHPPILSKFKKTPGTPPPPPGQLPPPSKTPMNQHVQNTQNNPVTLLKAKQNFREKNCTKQSPPHNKFNPHLPPPQKK